MQINTVKEYKVIKYRIIISMGNYINHFSFNSKSDI